MEASDTFNVLVVDDDPSMLASMEAVLADHFHVRTCASPGVALRLLERDVYHVICADWQMPEMSGTDFFSAVTQKQLSFEPCFILVTAYTSELLDPSFADHRKNLGILRKPFSPVELLERVHQFAGLARLRQSNRKLKAAVKGAG